ncbi:MAG: MerR family transcriptional regulator [Chloroflexi bacterium]|nr:MerR family transcriptional regulator [Chloroflexota bacterium]
MTSGTAAEAPRLLRIGELAQRLGLTERTIRYYEERGLLDTPRRTDGGARVYGDEDLRRLRFIQRLKALGLSLEEMHELGDIYAQHRSNRDLLPRLVELLDAHLAATLARMEELRGLADEISSYREHVRRRILGGAS